MHRRKVGYVYSLAFKLLIKPRKIYYLRDISYGKRMVVEIGISMAFVPSAQGETSVIVVYFSDCNIFTI